MTHHREIMKPPQQHDPLQAQTSLARYPNLKLIRQERRIRHRRQRTADGRRTLTRRADKTIQFLSIAIALSHADSGAKQSCTDLLIWYTRSFSKAAGVDEMKYLDYVRELQRWWAKDAVTGLTNWRGSVVGSLEKYRTAYKGEERREILTPDGTP